jgi:uncharacterized protein (TIGR03067 family)
MTRCISMVLVAGLLVAADTKKDDAKKDQEALRGVWTLVSTQVGGKDSVEEPKGTNLVIDGDTFTIKKGDEVRIKGTYKIDPSKTPKAIDLTITEGKERDKGKILLGIYELGKEGLKWCSSEPGGTERPMEFSAKEGSKDFLVTLKKEKK